MPTNPPLISVIMPVYNAERYVSQAVESILGQTLGDFELLIVDDGSTDGSSRILRRHAAHDPRIRITSRPNKGLVASLNELVDLARGEFLARMDADDIALPERFAKQAAYLHAHSDCVLVGSRVWEADPEGYPIREKFTLEEHQEIDSFHFQMRGTALMHPSIMMRRDAVLAVGKYRDFPIGEEVDLFLRLAERGRLARVPEFLLCYRVHAEGYSQNWAAKPGTYEAFAAMVADAYRRRGLPVTLPTAATSPPPDPPSVERDWAWAWTSLGHGHRKTARKYARRVLSRRPFSIDSWKLMFCALRGH